MEHLPFYVSALFTAVTFFSVIIFYKATGGHKPTLIMLLGWMTLQAVLALQGVFEVVNTIPPRLVFLVAPPIITIVLLFTTRKGRAYLDKIDVSVLPLLHALRIVVEIVLFQLFIYKLMPQLMTFEGRNMDIVSGVTAPLVYYFGYVKKKLNNGVLLAWNILCFCILMFTVINGVLAVPTPFQQLAFDQPNIAVLYFPFVWLVGVVVPLVWLSHLTAIRQLLRGFKIEHRSS